MPHNDAVARWVDETARHVTPARVVWCDGSEEERARLIEEAVSRGVLMPLNHERLPGCYLHRSDPSDVARTEQLTFICSESEDDAGPTNNWMAPSEARRRVGPLFRGAMRGRTMYVVPFLMGPPGSPFARVGVEITDSVYVVLSMRIMTRMGNIALEHLGSSDDFTRCLHSLGDLSPERRFVLHFPEADEVWSIGSGYGGNALLGKKCLALRIASVLGRREGWLAEHMLILGVTSPSGETRYVTGAFPSACGKTNLAMLVPPPSMPGWNVKTIGDDIAWLRVGADGRLYAVNPEAGFFGVVPGTSTRTNPNAVTTIARNTIYTNVALRPDGTVWWEGHDELPVAGTLDWQGRPWSPESGAPAAHPNSRFTAPASQCPSLAPEWERPEGVPVSAILFGARRRQGVPLVLQARSWAHGTFIGATMTSETTAAAVGKTGILRNDSMAMQPFCGYNMADYWAHWLKVGRQLAKPPQVFHVNWFRTGENGKLLWPGFGENLRVLEWVLARCEGRGDAVDTPIGLVPTREAICRRGLDVSDRALDELLSVDPALGRDALPAQREYLAKLGAKVPATLWEEHRQLAKRLHVE